MPAAPEERARFSWWGLLPQMLAIVILPLAALLLVVAFGGLRLHHLAMRSLVGERDVRAARAAASTLEEQLDHRASALQGLLLRPAPNSDVAGLSAILDESAYLLPDFDRGLAFFRAPDGILAYQGDEGLWESLPPGLLFDRLNDVKEASPLVVPISDPQGIRPVSIVIASPRADGLLVAGAFTTASFIQTALEDIFSAVDSSYVFVVDPQRHLLYQTGAKPDPGENTAVHPGVAQALQGQSGSTLIDVGGREHVVAYSPVRPVGWALIIEEPWEAVASPLLRATEYAPLLLFPVSVLSLITLWFGARRIVQPLRSLEAKASALGWGHFEAIEEPVGGVAEIRHLQTELIALARKVKAAQEGLRGYIGVMTHGLEEERRRLARELHDDTLQSLIALNQRIQLAMLKLDGTPGMESLGEIQEITENTIQDLRRVTRALRPIYLEDLGLVAALEMLARETQQLHDLTVQFQCTGSEQRLSPEVELALYRMVQEALSNVVRHAGASQASVEIRFSPLDVNVVIRDDGQGFVVPESPSAFAPGGHYGLLGLYERAALVGARLEIHSAVGQGTRVSVTLPVHLLEESGA